MREYVAGVGMKENDQRYYYITDRLGNVRYVLDGSGAVVQSYLYTPFGQIHTESGSLNQPYQYVGGEGYYSDEDVGLKLLGQRWYDAEVGRFISRDPIGEEGGLNLYVYVGNNPILLFDPEGEKVICKGFDLGATFVIGYGVVFGTSQYTCRDTCKNCIYSVNLEYRCKCIGVGISFGISYERCISSKISAITRGRYWLGGGSFQCLNFTVSISKTLVCGSVGIGAGFPISGVICRCNVKDSICSSCNCN